MKPTKTIHLSSLALLATLTACGGGGSSSDPVATPAPTTPVATSQPVPASTSLAVTGTAVHATALAGRAVDAKCKKGSGSATTGTDGSYTLAIANGELPCLVRVTEADTSTMHTLAKGTGLSASANVTPLTQLVVARLAGADPAAYYAAFDSTAAAFVTSAAATAAQASVVKTVQAGGIALTGFGDLMAAATSTVQGGVQRDALLQMDGALNASGTKLATLTLAVVNTAPATAAGQPVATTGVAMLPPDLLLKPAAAGCAALRSGSFRVATLANGLTRVSRMVINASTPAITHADGSSTKLLANGACRYKLDDASNSEIVVSQSGVLQMRVADGASFVVAIAMPEQLHDITEMAGVWNYASYLPDRNVFGVRYRGGITTATWGSVGSLQTSSACGDNDTWDFTICKDAGNSSRLLVNTDGGFDHVDINGASPAGRAFLYQSGSGDLLYVRTHFYGGWDIGTRQRTLALPGAAEVTAIHWKLPVTTVNFAEPLTLVTETFLSNDAVAASYSVNYVEDGGIAHIETMLINNPRVGYFFQPGGPGLAFAKTTNLVLRGMGFLSYFNQDAKAFRLRVVQPKS